MSGALRKSRMMHEQKRRKAVHEFYWPRQVAVQRLNIFPRLWISNSDCFQRSYSLILIAGGTRILYDLVPCISFRGWPQVKKLKPKKVETYFSLNLDRRSLAPRNGSLLATGWLATLGSSWCVSPVAWSWSQWLGLAVRLSDLIFQKLIN